MKYQGNVWDTGRHWRFINSVLVEGLINQIMVSEIMLQQTQVARVCPKYQAFIEAFPTVTDLAKAPLVRVLTLWQGLGYNRRARALRAAALCIVCDHNGVFPTTYETILALPGVGPYTAGAILAFAYNKGVPIIETNIRTVFKHFCFRDTEVPVSDRDILPLVAYILPSDTPRDWYAALMDYGSMLKQTTPNLQSRRIAVNKKQSPFRDSARYWRGRIIALAVSSRDSISTSVLESTYPQLSAVRRQEILDSLIRDGLLEVTRQGTYHIPIESR